MRCLQALVVTGLLGVLMMYTEGSGRGEKPVPPARGGTKPPWQRMLRGEEARRAAAQEQKLKQLRTAGKFEEALRVAQALAELRSKAQGTDHWEAVNTRWQVEALRRVLRQEERGRADYVRSFSLMSQGVALMSKGRYKEAHPLLEKVLAICQKVLGEEHPDTAQIYNNLAANLHSQGQNPEAGPLYRKALAIRRKVLSEEHPATAISYKRLADNMAAQGHYKEAETGYRTALAIWRKVLGENHPGTAACYNALAESLYGEGRYAKAEESFRKALTIRRKVLGEEHAVIAGSYNDLAGSVGAQGRFAEAGPLFCKALTIRRKVLGENHHDTASSYNNVAVNLGAQGRYAEAEQGCRKALAIWRTIWGEEHRWTAIGYNNVAAKLGPQGKYAEAESFHRKALAIFRKVLGEDHPSTAVSYNNVASNLYSQGRYKEAGPLFRKALAIYRNVQGDDYPAVATSYNNLAKNLLAQGRYKEAEEDYRKALAIFQKLLGVGHPSTAGSYSLLAQALSWNGQYAEAETLWRQAAESFTKNRLRIATGGLDRATITSEHSSLPSLAAVLARNGKPAEAWQRFEEGLGRGTWDDLSARLRRPPAEQAKQTELVNRLNRLDQLIERTFTRKEPTRAQLKRREDLLGQRDKLQDVLTDFVHHLEEKYGPAAGQVFKQPALQAALPPDVALIAWLDIPGHPKAKDPNGDHWAILLRSTGDPVWVRLRGSGDKDAWTDADTRLPAQLRAALQAPRGDWRPLARRLRRQRLDPLAKHLTGVRRLIVLPSTALAGVPVETFADGYTVSYALSGTLYAHQRKQARPTTAGLLALGDPIFDAAAVAVKPRPLPPGGVLLTVVVPGSNAARSRLKPNDVLLRYNGSDLAGPADLKPLLAAADPNKPVPVTVWRDGKTMALAVRPGRLGVVMAGEPAPRALAALRRLDRRLASAARGGDEEWLPLPGTRAEVAALGRLFAGGTPRLLFDAQASEQQLYDLANSGDLGRYRFLHLATHGTVDDRFPLRSAVILSRDALPDPGKQLDAGLPVYDGRLTAEEVLRQWHLNCELVTLSACQTALGKYERGEGHVGFAQALILAGSRSVCLSLWRVDDAATALLMERFYRNLLGRRAGLKGPMPKAAALAEAKAWLRGLSREEAARQAASLTQGVARGKGRKALPLLPALPATGAKDDKPYAHPYYWAAFVLLGDPE